MLFRRTYGVAILVGLILGALIAVQVASILDVGGVSRVVRPPETGVGTKCAEGDKDSCWKLCLALSDVSTLRCVNQLARVFPRVEAQVQGGGGSSGGSSSPSIPAPSPSGGGGGNGQPTGPPGPPGTPPPTTPSPPSNPDPIKPITDLVCRTVPPLGIRVCN